MKERRGTVARLAGLAEGVAAAARRRQRERAPRVTLYDADGHARLLSPDDDAFDEIVGAAERMLALGAGSGTLAREGREPDPPSSTRGVSVRSAEVGQEPHGTARGGTRDEV